MVGTRLTEEEFPRFAALLSQGRTKSQALRETFIREIVKEKVVEVAAPVPPPVVERVVETVEKRVHLVQIRRGKTYTLTVNGRRRRVRAKKDGWFRVSGLP